MCLNIPSCTIYYPQPFKIFYEPSKKEITAIDCDNKHVWKIEPKNFLKSVYEMQRLIKNNLNQAVALSAQLSSLNDAAKNQLEEGSEQVQQNISTHEKQANEINQSRKFSGPTL